MSNDFKRFLRIREEYATILPAWEAEYKATGNMHHDPYFLDWAMDFTPIEQAVWNDIRSAGLPFYPQIPVLNYFIDFGCPMLKIGIECDGKAWHDHDIDKARDARLAAAGWTLFRIEGHKCKRTLAEPWSECDDDISDREVDRWFMETSEGILYAINSMYFTDERRGFDDKYAGYIRSTLFEHKSTPYNEPPHRRPVTRQSEPRLIGHMLQDYMETLVSRMRAGEKKVAR